MKAKSARSISISTTRCPPRLFRTTISICSAVTWLNLVLLGCAGLALLYGVIRGCSLLPSHRKPRATGDRTPAYAPELSIRRDVVYPALAWTLLVPWLLDFASVHAADEAQARPWLADHAFWILPAVYFLLMTLGPALVALALLERKTFSTRNPVIVFGRVPLFYYVVHLALIHFLYFMAHRFLFPAQYYPLWVTYAVWILVVSLLYPACLWYGRKKQQRPKSWLSAIG